MDELQKEERWHWPVSVLSSVSSLINMLLPLFLVRILTPEEIGTYKIFFLYLLIAPGLSMIAGVTSGIAYWAGQKERFAALQVSSLLIFASGVFFTVLAFIFQGPITSLMGWDPKYSLVFALALFGTIAGGFFEEAAISTGRIWSGAVAYAGFEILRTLSIVVSAVLTRSVLDVFLTHTLLVTLKTCVTYVAGMRLGIVGFKPSKKVFFEVWNYALPVSMAWVFGVFVDRADQLILSRLISPTRFAFYTIGCLIVPPLFTLEHSITRVLIPQLSECFALKDDRRAARLYSEAVESLAFLFFPAVTGLIVFAKPIIVILFTTQYASASHYLEFFALSYLAMVFPNDAVPRAKGQAGWILKNFSLFSVMALVCAFVLTEIFGPYGALIAVLINKAVMRGYAMYYIHRETGWQYRMFLPLDAFARIWFVCGLLALGCFLVRPLFTSAPLWFMVCAPLFALAYFPLVLSLKSLRPKVSTPEKRVMLLTQCMPIGGLERTVFDLARALHKERVWQPFVVAYDQSSDAVRAGFIPKMRSEGIITLHWRKPAGFSPRVAWRIVLLLVRYDIKVLHSHNIGPLIYGCLAKVILFGRLRIVHTQHSLLHIAESKRYASYEKFFAKFVDEIVIVSPDMADTYKNWGIRPEKIHVVLNGVNSVEQLPTERQQRLEGRDALIDSSSTKELRAYREAAWLLYLARLHPVKGQSHAIRLWSELSAADRARSVLLFVGPESHPNQLSELRTLAAVAPDAQRIFFLGGTHESAKWYRSSDVFISCSDFEGLPLAPLEALSEGLPTMLSDIPGHRFLADVSLSYPLEEPLKGGRILTELIEQVFSDPNYAAGVTRRNNWAREAFSIERMTSEYSALYSARPS